MDNKRKTLSEKLNYNTSLIKVQKLQNLRLDRPFFNVRCQHLATSLLGKILVRKLNDAVILKGRIVETECYPGGDDKASHSFNGRRTNNNEPMYMEPGTAYVYKIYGIYCCFNISSIEPGGAVLIRALEPLTEIDYMRLNRINKSPSKKQLKDKELCNGPSKLCISMLIDKESCNKENLITSQKMWLEDDDFKDLEIVTSTRIGIESCGAESVSKLLRFYVLNNSCVSKRDKSREILKYN